MKLLEDLLGQLQVSSILEKTKPIPKVKEPKQVLNGKTWVVENFKTGDLTFNEINHSNTLQIFSCSNTTVIVGAKVKSVLVEGCQKLTLKLNGVVTSLKILNSSQITVEADHQLPMANIERTKEVKIHLTHATKNIKVQCSLSSSVFLRFPKEGDTDGSVEKNDYVL